MYKSNKFLLNLIKYFSRREQNSQYLAVFKRNRIANKRIKCSVISLVVRVAEKYPKFSLFNRCLETRAGG